MPAACFRLVRRLAGALGLACLFSLPVVAKTAVVPPLPPDFRPPRLVIADAATTPIRLDSVRIDSEIYGGEALTRVELVFFNPNSRVLEGELQFPLLAGQQIVGMAMDMGGKLRDAVPVDKARGQEIFEEVTRQRVDPALLEVTQGNNFKLRVYPLPPQGSKRVVLRIGETLPVRDRQQIFRLPLAYAANLPQLDLGLRVYAAEQKPVAVGGKAGALVFAQKGDIYEAKLSRKDFAGSGVLEIRIPVATRDRVSTQEFAGKTYFRAEIPAPAVKAAPRRLPKRIAIYWDASGSGTHRDHSREFALLERYFKAFGTGDATLVIFANTADKPEKFSVTGGNWQALKTRLEKIAYDGATNLANLPPVTGAEEALVFSDGLANFDRPGLPELGVPTYAIGASASADTNVMRAIAERSRGRLIDLQRLTDTEAADRLLATTAEVIDAGGDGLTQVLVESRWLQDGRFLVAGIVAPGGGKLQVKLRLPGGKSDQLLAISVAAQQNAGSLAAMTWARLKLAELDADYAVKRGEIKRLGQLFRLPTRETSLIILDTAADYARYEVEPPPELAAQVEQLKGRRPQAQDPGRHIEGVVRRFQEKQAWWNKEFPKDSPAKVAADAKQEALSGAVSSHSARPLAPMMAMPAPAPAATAQAEAAPAAAKKAKGGGDREAPAATITLKKWTADAPYIRRLQEATVDRIYAIYLDERPNWANSSAFYLDAADTLFDKGQTALAVRVLSNLAEMNLENRALLRILGYRLMQAKQPALAVHVFERVRELAPHEPQSLRDLGLAYAATGQPQKAIDALWEVVSKTWTRQVPEVDLIALAELNAIIATSPTKLDVGRIDPRLLKNLPLDLRVTLSWDTDNSDMDLWVIDPNGEKSFYGHRLSYQGGRMSADVTGGYGPEEYSLKTAKPGKYLVQANFYGHRQQVISAATTLQLKLQTGFGTERQKEEIITLRLKGQRDVVTVGEFEVK